MFRGDPLNICSLRVNVVKDERKVQKYNPLNRCYFYPQTHFKQSQFSSQLKIFLTSVWNCDVCLNIIVTLEKIYLKWLAEELRYMHLHWHFWWKKKSPMYLYCVYQWPYNLLSFAAHSVLYQPMYTDLILPPMRLRRGFNLSNGPVIFSMNTKENLSSRHCRKLCHR